MATTNIVDLQTVGSRAATVKHPIYTVLEEEWRKLADVREGTGGFLDGLYLVAHPREWKDHDSATPTDPTKKLLARRNLARYENLAASILESFQASLFRTPATRRAGLTDDTIPVEAWWDHIDGVHSVTELMPYWWDLAATFGHLVLLFQLPADTDPLTAADQGMPVVRPYTPLDVINWIEDDAGQLVSVRFLEAVQPTDYVNVPSPVRTRVRTVTETEWILTNDRGQEEARGEHGLGRLPVVYLYGKRRPILRHVGQSLLGNSSKFLDLFNLTSEGRELIRNQTFSQINVPLGTGADAVNIEQAQTMLGKQSGSMNVLFSALPASILSADASNVQTIHEEIRQLKRDIFRESGVPWESDSRAAESGDSLRIRREDLNTRLATHADLCQQAERELANLFYRWQVGPDAAEDAMERDELTVSYPARFDSTPFEELLAQVETATSLKMPTVFLNEYRKALLGKFEGMGDLEPGKRAEILEAIDAMEDEPDPLAAFEGRMAQIEGQIGAVPDDEPDEDAPDDEDE